MVRLFLLLALLAPAFPGWSQKLLINEIAAAVVNSQVDDYGEFEDWIEIYNPTKYDIDVGGWFLTDNLNKPTKWRIPHSRPELTTVHAGGYLLLFADGDTLQGPVHLGFALNKSGEQLGLFNSDGENLVLMDSVSYDNLQADCSYGRCPEHKGLWSVLNKPTPGKANICPRSRKTK